MKIGIAVECVLCHRRKKPWGRSAPDEIANSLCDPDCAGYHISPRIGDLWPGETEAEFGYPVSSHGTRDNPTLEKGEEQHGPTQTEVTQPKENFPKED